MHPSILVNAATCLIKSVTVPANASTATTLASQASLTQDQIDRCVGTKISGLCSDGSTRAAMIHGNSTASLPHYIAAGELYGPDAFLDDASGNFYKAASGAAISNVVVFFYLK